jgi:hypothetical protein
MQLSQIHQSYDLILSMGYNCQSALHLRGNQIRSFTGPVDWVISNSIPVLIQQLEKGFRDYMKLENLKIIGSIYGHFSVEDAATGILSFHDFPVPPDQRKCISNYPEYRKQLDRRIQRFYQAAKASKRALYVRERTSPADAVKLRLALERLSGKEVYLLAVNYTDALVPREVEWGLPYISAVEIPVKEPERADAWKKILTGFSLTP